MNKQKIELLARIIEDNPQIFDLANLFISEDKTKTHISHIEKPDFKEVDAKIVLTNKCSTTFCFAGLAVILFSGRMCHMINWDDIMEEASALLGIDHEEAKDLFYDPLSPDTTFIESDKKRFSSDKEYAEAGAKKLRDFSNGTHNP